MMNNVNNVDEIVANALQTQFNSNIIFHDDIPEHGSYPVLCYTDISETPVLHADNKIYAREHIIRVTVVTWGNAGINELKEKIESCMTEAGGMWQTTNKTRDGKEYYTSLDFSFGMEE